MNCMWENYKRCTELERNWGELYWMLEYFERDIMTIIKL